MNKCTLFGCCTSVPVLTCISYDAGTLDRYVPAGDKRCTGMSESTECLQMDAGCPGPETSRNDPATLWGHGQHLLNHNQPDGRTMEILPGPYRSPSHSRSLGRGSVVWVVAW